MAIRIQRGGSASDVAGQIIAQAGQGEANRRSQELQAIMQLAGGIKMGPVGGGGGGGGGGGRRLTPEISRPYFQLSEAGEKQKAEIRAQAERDEAAADTATALTAVKFGLEEEMQQQEFENTLAQKHEEARIQANQWDVKFSQEQKQQIAKINTAKQRIADSDDFTPEEKSELDKRLELNLAGMQAGVVPADLNKPNFEDGHEPGKLWESKTGDMMTSKLDGTPDLIASWERGREAFEIQAKNDVESARMSAYEKFATSTVTKDGLTSTPNAQQVSDLMAGWDRERAFMESQSQQQQEPQPEQQPLRQDVATRPAVTMTEENADTIYESLRPGDEYIGPDGKRYRKPGLLPQEPIPLRGFTQ